jgi:hypothetical protein
MICGFTFDILVYESLTLGGRGLVGSLLGLELMSGVLGGENGVYKNPSPSILLYSLVRKESSLILEGDGIL